MSKDDPMAETIALLQGIGRDGAERIMALCLSGAEPERNPVDVECEAIAEKIRAGFLASGGSDEKAIQVTTRIGLEALFMHLSRLATLDALEPEGRA